MCAEISRDFQRFPRFPKDFVGFPRQVYEISVSDGPLASTVTLAAHARRGLGYVYLSRT